MSRPGAFSAVASTRAVDFSRGERWLTESMLPLPCAVLVHLGHYLPASPVAVAVPRYDPEFGGVLYVDGVFSSWASRAWFYARERVVGMSLAGHVSDSRALSDGVVEFTRSSIYAVDFVTDPANRSARIESTTPFEELSLAQLEVQERFDDYLADKSNPRGIDLRYRCRTEGPFAMHCLWPVVSSLHVQRARAGREVTVGG